MHGAGGKQLGSLVRVVVDRDSWDPVALVVNEKARYSGHPLGTLLGMFPAEVVVPIDACRHADRERVELTITATQFRHLPPYLYYEYHEYDQGGADAAGRATLSNVAAAVGFNRMPPPFQELANKAGDQIEIRKDESVMIGHEGQRLGRIDDVVFDGGELAGAVVRLDRQHSGDRVLVPVRFFDRSDDGALFVGMSEEQIARLRPAGE